MKVSVFKMPYPDSPFVHLEPQIELEFSNLVNKEEISISDLQKWICIAPNMTTIRFNESITKYENFLEILKQKIKDPPHIFRHPILSDVIVIESEPCIQLLNDHTSEVVVDTAVGAAILRGAHIYAPGVKGLTGGSKIGEIVKVNVDLQNQCNRGFSKNFEGTKIYVGYGILKQQRHQLFSSELCQGVAVEMIQNIANCPIIDEREMRVHGGLFQNLPSVLCGHILSPKPGDRVLDMCAAPGNKTTHLSMIMKNQGIIFALEKVKSKINTLVERCKEFNATNVRVFQFDSTKSVTEELDCLMAPPFSCESFDKILLDAPCSGLGQRPQFYNKMTVKELRSYVPLQRKLFTNAVSLLKPGGLLLYSTCTITLAENEMMVAWALIKFPCLELLPSEPRVSGPGWKINYLTGEQCSKLQRFSHLDKNCDSLGFFIALFKKKYN